MTYIITLLVASILTNLVVAAVILIKGDQQRSYRYFGFSALSLVLWTAGDMVMLAAHQISLAHLGVRLFLVGPMVTTFLLVLFSWSFLGSPDTKRPKTWLIGFSLFSLPILIWTIAYPSQILTIAVTTGENMVSVHAPALYIYSSYIVIHFFAAYIILLIKQRHHIGRERAQLSYAYSGIVLSSSLALISNILLPIFGITALVWLGPLFTVFYVITITMAIVRHQLFDIRTIVARSVAYLVSLFVLASLYGVVVFGVATLLFHLEFSLLTQMVISGATALAALIFNAIKRFFDRASARLFYRDAYDSEELLETLNRLYVSNTNLGQLLTRTAAVLKDSLKAEYCIFGIKESGDSPSRILGHGEHPSFSDGDVALLRSLTPHIHHKVIVADALTDVDAQLRNILLSNNIAILARLTASTKQTAEGIGSLILGPRRSGNSYTPKDLRTIEIIVNELVIAIENGLRFEQIQHFNKTLRQNVDEATRKLRNSNKKLQSLDETKDEFITMASHQLRTPLTSVKGYLSMVLEGDVGKLNAQQTQMLTQSYISAQRMVYLISDLLNLSRLGTGKFLIESTPVDLKAVVQDELNQLHETAKSRGVILGFDAPEQFPLLLLDETKIHQVVMNLIDNAIYYTPAGGTIQVALHETPTAVEFRVVDTGIGVPKAVQHKLFTKFYRAQNAQAARPDGTGIGLFMAKKVVVAQGGAIIFDSTEGVGSTFGFRFSKAHHLAKAAK